MVGVLRRGPRRHRGLLAACAVAVLLGACTAPAGRQPLLEGLAQHSTARYTIAYPAGWQVERDDAGGRLGVWVVAGPAAADGLRPGVAVERQTRLPGDLAAAAYVAVFDAAATAALPDRVVLDRQPVAVPGAWQAVRIEVEYRLEGGDADARVRQVDILAFGRDGEVVNARVYAGAGAFEAPWVEAVLGSFRLND